MNDVLIHARTKEEHLTKKVKHVLTEAGLVLNIVYVSVQSVRFLSHVSNDGLRADPEKVKVVFQMGRHTSDPPV